MTKDNKITKGQRQKGADAHGAQSLHSTAKVKRRYSKHGTPQSHSKPTETWAKTSERAAITRRSKKAPITLPKMPWEVNKED